MGRKRGLIERIRKRGVVWDSLMPWLIGVLALVLIVGLYLILSGKGVELLDKINSLLRFGK
jgi:hypothetical protein